jgi:hypothetical protein
LNLLKTTANSKQGSKLLSKTTFAKGTEVTVNQTARLKNNCQLTIQHQAKPILKQAQRHQTTKLKDKTPKIKTMDHKAYLAKDPNLKELKDKMKNPTERNPSAMKIPLLN